MIPTLNSLDHHSILLSALLLMEEILHQLRLVVYPNICEFFTSQVVVSDFFHQQYLKGLSYWVAAYFQGLMSSSFNQGILSKRREPLLSTASKPTESSTSQKVRGSVFSSNPVFSWSLTLPETNSSPLKIDGWKITFLLGWPIFRCHVSVRVCINRISSPNSYIKIQ